MLKKKRISLNRRLILIPTVIFIPLLIIILYLLVTINQLSNLYDDITANVNIANKYATECKEVIDNNAYLAVTQKSSFKQLVKQKRKLDAKIIDPYIYLDSLEEACTQLSMKATVKKNKTTTRNLYISIATLKKHLNELEKMIKTDESMDSQLDFLNDNIYSLTSIINDGIQEYILEEASNYNYAKDVLDSKKERAIEMAIGLTIIAIVAAIIMSYMALRSVTKPIKQLCKMTTKVGQGDFTVKTSNVSTDEIGVLTDSFNNMTREIGELVQAIKKEQSNLRLTEMKLLQEQITPHFLYNTLDTIVWLAEENKTKDVVTMVTSLSDFFRTGLSEGREVILIKDEVEHIVSYLQIQGVRYQDILEYEINVDDDIKSYEIPKLTLQPLVENALYHGIKNKRGGGKIIVEGKKDKDNNVIINVIDSGKGMDKELLENVLNNMYVENIDKSKKGYGLRNVCKRLKYYYGDECELSIESDENNGTKVTILIKSKKIEIKS